MYFVKKMKRMVPNLTMKKKNRKSTQKGGGDKGGGDKVIGDKIQKYIKKYKAVIVVKTYCPHCKKALSYLKKTYEEKDLKVMVIDNDKYGVQAYVKRKYKHRTVPVVFINGKGPYGNSNMPTKK